MNQPKPISFLVFSDDWGEHPSSCQHIFKHIVKDHKVLWVNTIGMRGMKLTRSDFKKALIKLRKMFFGAKNKKQESHEQLRNLTVVQPFMLPFLKIPIVRWLNTLCVIRNVKKKMAAIGMQTPIFVTTVPNACDYVGNFGEKKKVYYCVDDFVLWPGLDHNLVLEMENELVKRCDIFFATSTKLYDRLKKTGKPATLLTHGVDIEHFSNLPKLEHPLLDNIPKPRVGYFGLFDERSDQDLLAEVATRMPEVSFVITGNVVTDISYLKTVPNIYFTGSVPYMDIPAVVTGWHACLLPYQVNTLTESINPLKLKEYLASGKPVITSELPETTLFSRFLHVARSAEEWVAHLTSAVLSGERPIPTSNREQVEYLMGETWKRKADEFLSFVMKEVTCNELN